MANIKAELIQIMNTALELEHAARIQYLAHAELIQGINAEPIVERLKEIASDEQKHEGIFRELIGNYLGGEPSMGLAETHPAKETTKILKVNLKDEKAAIDFYKQIYEKVNEYKKELPYAYETLEHEIRHIIIDEQEHVTELALLLAKCWAFWFLEKGTGGIMKTIEIISKEELKKKIDQKKEDVQISATNENRELP